MEQGSQQGEEVYKRIICGRPSQLGLSHHLRWNSLRIYYSLSSVQSLHCSPTVPLCYEICQRSILTVQRWIWEWLEPLLTNRHKAHDALLKWYSKNLSHSLWWKIFSLKEHSSKSNSRLYSFPFLQGTGSCWCCVSRVSPDSQSLPDRQTALTSSAPRTMWRERPHREHQ